MKKNLVSYISYTLSMLVLAGCSKMDATYVDFIRDGKIVYPGKADSVQVHPGKNRIQLSWLLIDPNVVSTRIYWNEGSDSLEIPVERPSGVTNLEVMLADMEEGTYTFELYTHDNEGNESIKVEVRGQVYGNAYTNSLLAKPVQETIPGIDTTWVYWGETTAEAVGTELEYTSQTGTLRRLFAPAEDSVTILPDFEPGTDFRYRTLFLPDSMAIDTFYTGYTVITVPEPMQDFALSKVATGSSDCGCGPLTSITDGDYDTYWQPQGSDRGDLNIWTNIDLGTLRKFDAAHIYWSAPADEEDQVASYRLLVSNDAENWELAFEKTSGITMEEQAVFPEVTARYLKLDILLKTPVLLRTHAVEIY